MLARKSGARWFVAGINAGADPREVDLDLARFGAGKALLITDGEGGGNLSFRREALDTGTARITIAPNGGFVAVTEPH